VLHVVCATMVTLLVPAFGRDELSRCVLTVLSLLLLLANLTLLFLLLLLRLRLLMLVLMSKLILLLFLISVGMLLLLLSVYAVRIRTVLHHAGAWRSRGRFGPHWCSVTLAIVASVQTVPVVSVVVPLCATVVIIVVIVIVIVVVVTRSKVDSGENAWRSNETSAFGYSQCGCGGDPRSTQSQAHVHNVNTAVN
jgi:hypothetical protein